MSASVVVKEGNGASVTWTTVTQIRFKTKDEYARDLAYPIPIPSTGLNYSYWKHLCLYISGTFSKINNIKAYADGAVGWAMGSAGLLRVGVRDSGDNGCPTANYQQAAGTEGTTGKAIEDQAGSDGHAYYKGQTTKVADLAGYTSASPLTLDTTDYTTTGYTKSIVLQIKLDTDATRGLTANEVLTFQYDEI